MLYLRVSVNVLWFFEAKDFMIVASVSLPQFKLRRIHNEVDRIRVES